MITRHSRGVRGFLGVASSSLVMLAGCAGHGDPGSQPEAEPVHYTFKSETICPGLQRLLESSRQQFSDISGRTTAGSNHISVWQTTLQAENAECRIVDMGGGNPNYLCTVALPGAQSAQNWHQSLQSTLSGCLGPSWKTTDTDDRQGVVTTFANASASPSIINVRHYRNEKMLSSKNWTGVFSIGRPPG